MADRSKADRPLTLDLPKADADRPPWRKVGAIAVFGFVVGIAWPQLAGVRLGPSAPSDAPSSSSSSSATVTTAQGGAAGSAVTTTTASGAPLGSGAGAGGAAHADTEGPAAAMIAGSPESAGGGAAAGANGPSVSVGHGILLSCRSEDGENLKGRACGSLGFDALALPRLRRLGKCPAAAGAEGQRLPIAFALDFKRNSIVPSIGRTTTTVAGGEAIATCVRSLFEGASLSAVDHENVRYGVLYHVSFGKAAAGASPGTATANAPPIATTGGTPGATATATPSSAGGGAGAAGGAGVETGDDSSGGATTTTQVVWDVAIVRDQPRTGTVVARLPRGSKVQVGAGQEGWYRVRAGSAEGWVYRAAIGK